MKRLLNLFPKDSNKISLVVSIGFGALIFLITLASTRSLLIGGLVGAATAVIGYIGLIFGEKVGQKRHISIIRSSGFQKLRTLGFQVEEKNKYSGLTGAYNGYIFDIYFDWSTFVRSKVYKAVIFNVYFAPPVKSDDTIDHNKLKHLSEKYDVSYWSFKNYNFWWRARYIIMRNGVGLFNPSYKKLVKRMSLVTNIFKAEGLKPVDRNTITQRRNTDYLNNIPEIELYHGEK